MMGRVSVSSSSRLLLTVFSLAAFGLASAGAWGATCSVTSTDDGSSAATTTGTLRNCLSNLSTGTALSTNSITISATGTITLSSALPTIGNGVAITGPGARSLTINGAGHSIFVVSSGNSVSISGLTISGGSGFTSGSINGGGALFNQGTTTLQNSAVTSNSATSGGAIYNAGTLTISDSTFSGNTAQDGGAITNGGGETLTLTGSTFVNNSTTTNGGGAIENNGTLTATNNTFVGNTGQSGGGAIANINGALGILTSNNNLFVENVSSGPGAGIDNASGSTANASYNVYYKNLASSSEDDCNGCTSNTNATSASLNPLTLPLGYYGGPTQTFLPQPGSAAIGAGSSTVDAGLTADQRGFPLVTSQVDAGSVQTNYIQVTSNKDTGTNTLRDAIATANTAGSGDIDFTSTITSIALSSSNGTLGLSASTGINIIGPGANALTVSGGSSSANFPVFTVDANVSAVLDGLTISSGGTAVSGGDISNLGNLTVLGAALTSSATSNSGNGGAINNISGALLIEGSTISGNFAASGGGIYSASSMEIVESTVSGNTVSNGTNPANGGGIFNSSGTLTIINSTIAGNSATGTAANVGGGIDVAGGTVSLANSIVSGNTVGTGGSNSNIGGTITDGGGNVIGGGTDANSDLLGGTGAAITLSALGLNPATAAVQTQVPLPGGAAGNPAICGGLSANLAAGITTDERGQPISPNDCSTGSVDSGAVQTAYTMSFTANPTTPVTVDEGFGATVTLNESGQPFAGVSIPLALLQNGTASSATLSGTTTQTTDSSGNATYSGLSTTVGTNYTLSATLALNASASLTAASTAFVVNAAPTQVSLTPASQTSTVNQSLTFNATISPNVTNPIANSSFVAMTGTVAFSVGGTAITNCGSQAITYSSTNGNATASCTTSALPAGNPDNITAVFNPSGANSSEYATSAVSNTVTATVSKANTTIALSSDPSNPTSPGVGDSLQFDATVSTSNQTVAFLSSGTVTFTDTTTHTVLCQSAAITPSNGTATCTTTALSLGGNSVTAVFNGDANYNASPTSNTVSVTLVSNPTHSLSGSPNPVAAKATVTFTESVTGPKKATQPSGSIAFSSSTTGLPGSFTTISGCGSVTISNGQAQCPTSFTNSGQYTIQAIYNGDTNYAGFTDTYVEQVSTGSSSIALVSNNGGTSTVNEAVSFTATVGPASANPALSGTVTFVDTSNGNAQLCSGKVDPTTQTATCPAPGVILPLTLGTHKIQADYSGDTNYSNSSSNLVTLQVNAGTATISTVSSSSNPSIVNNQVTFTATVVAPAGPTQPVGTVQFTAVPTGGGSTSTLCSQAKLILSSPTSTTGTATCGPITSLAANTYTITATYTDTNGNFTSASNTLTQTVQPAGTTVVIAAAPSATTVNTQVTYTVTATAASATYPLTGTVQITDENGNVICSGLTLTQVSGSPTGTNDACTQSNLTAGVHTITATYNLSGTDTNNGKGSGSTPVPVAPAGTSVTVTSSLNPSIVSNPNNVSDTVTLTAMVTPSSAGTVSVPLSGSVTFTENGRAIPECPLPVSVTAPVCTTTSLPAGQDTILAVYSNDNNYTGSTGYLTANGQVVTQTVQDYSLVISSTPPVQLSQGYTTSSDLFTPQTISVVPLSIQGFATATSPTPAPLNLACTVTTVFSAVSSPTLPNCVPQTATLPVSGTGPQGAVSIVVDATNASAGIYTVTETGTDPTTQLVHSASFPVTVNAASSPVTVVSGATTGNSGNLTFMLPAGVTVTNFLCKNVSGPNLTGSVLPSTLGITCAFNPTSATNTSATMQAVQVNATIGTGGSSNTTTTAAVRRNPSLWFAGLLGIPLFGLVGLIRGRKSRDSAFFRLLVIAIICVVAFQAVGCGGSFSTQPSNSGNGGTTPPGVYKILVVGSGSDGNTYQAVLQLNVQL